MLAMPRTIANRQIDNIFGVTSKWTSLKLKANCLDIIHH
jgi:hypothetical protein